MDTLINHELRISEQEKYEKVWKSSQYRNAVRSERKYDSVAYWLRSVGAKTVIDIGIGTGRLASMLSNEFDVTGLDIASNCLDEGINVPLIVGSIWDDLDIGTFDCLICMDVLEHIPTEFVSKAIENIGSLAPHGILVIALDEERIKFDEPLHLTIKPVEWWDAMIPFATVDRALYGGAVAKY